MALTITEIVRRSDQGATRPFLCRGDDDRFYFVKGRGAGWRSLCTEWVAGCLAQELDLATPEMAIAYVPPELIASSDRDDLRDLGAGPVFASARLEGPTELTWAEAEKIPEGTKARLLLFDLWVRNEDRSLSALGGNPNLLVGPNDSCDRKLWIFDFNLAFDTQFDHGRFFDVHVFGSLLPQWPLAFRSELEPVLQAAAATLPAIWNSLPPEWLSLDGYPQEPPPLDEGYVEWILAHPFETPDTFWLRP